MAKEKLLENNQIYLWIPRKHILKLYYQQRHLNKKDYAFLLCEMKVLDENINRLLHAQSIVEKCLLKTR